MAPMTVARFPGGKSPAKHRAAVDLLRNLTAMIAHRSMCSLEAYLASGGRVSDSGGCHLSRQLTENDWH